jgi:hypothetical protein
MQGSRCGGFGIRLVTKTSEVHFRESAFSRPLVIPAHIHGHRTIESVTVFTLASLRKLCASGSQYIS